MSRSDSSSPAWEEVASGWESGVEASAAPAATEVRPALLVGAFVNVVTVAFSGGHAMWLFSRQAFLKVRAR